MCLFQIAVPKGEARKCKQTVIDLQRWKVVKPLAEPTPFKDLLHEVKLSNLNPGDTPKNFKRKMKPVTKRRAKKFFNIAKKARSNMKEKE